jgi:hypothetical protein
LGVNFQTSFLEEPGLQVVIISLGKVASAAPTGVPAINQI